MILFSEVYDKSVNLFDDPDIQRAYVFDKIKFQKMMYRHFKNGIALFTNPMSIAFQLVNQEDPDGKIEIFDGNGGSTYSMSTTPKENSLFSFKIDGKTDDGASFDKDTNSVIFSKNVESNQKCSVEWYYCGCFTTDFSNVSSPRVSSGTIMYYVKEILARSLILAWAEKEKNFVLDIRNLLNDTDFKIYSPANSIKSKIDWVKDLRFQFDNLQTKLGWTMFGQLRSGGQLYGP